jgi:hypothetical protein
MASEPSYIDMLKTADLEKATLKARVVELSKALETLVIRASQCDSWESFPEDWLDEADKVLSKAT